MNIKSIGKALGLGKIPFVRPLYNKIVERTIPNKDIILPCLDMRILVRNPRESFIGRSIYLSGIWEKEVTEFVTSKIKPGMTILDIGADIGYYSILFAKLVGPGGRVYCFEPIPKARWYLDRNIKMNKLDNIKYFSFALFDREGTVCLEDPFTKSKINCAKKTLTGNDIQVEMKVFDNYRLEAGIEQIDIVKIDVEGAEMNILQGMKNTLKDMHPGILIEVHPQQLKSFNYEASDIIDFLKELNYQIEPIDKPEIDFFQENITLFCQSLSL